MDYPATFDIDRELLLRCHRAALTAVDPIVVSREAILRRPGPGGVPSLLAIGKAAEGMLTGAIQALASRGVEWHAALAIPASPWSEPPDRVEVIVADHPVPGTGSFRASERLGEWLTETGDSPVVVMLSGGTSSLIAAPLPAIARSDFVLAWTSLQRAGLDIIALNSLRRRLTRWGGGRLGEVLGDRTEAVYLISDVAGNRLETIGSGPLVGGTEFPDVVAGMLADHELMASMSQSVLNALMTPPPEFGRLVPHVVVADGRMAQRGAEAEAIAAGLNCEARAERLDCTAANAATLVSAAVLELVERRPTRAGTMLIWAAEMTVSLPNNPGSGGRAQQFAMELGLRLEELAASNRSLADVLVLAASTDGRDGPTDAAGAFSWSGLPRVVREGGRSPAGLIARADVHGALEAAGALVRTGATGTNVADLVLALMR